MIYPLDELPENIYFSFDAHLENSSTLLNCTLTSTPIEFTTYKSGFDIIMDHLHNGNTYLLNYTCQTPITCSHTLKEIYTHSKAPFKLFIENEFLVSSPERFIKISNNIIETFPMKGTSDTSNGECVNDLLNDEKESREHLMVVDLLRNDLAMVASNVRVNDYRFAHTIHAGDKSLLQTSSHISGYLDDDWHSRIGTILDTLLPAGSITGAPKRSTCEIIDQVEPKKRGYYTGVFGVFDGENLDSAVCIRFIKQTDDGLVYHSGGGITLLSDSVSEYNEMIKKIYVPIN